MRPAATESGGVPRRRRRLRYRVQHGRGAGADRRRASPSARAPCSARRPERGRRHRWRWAPTSPTSCGVGARRRREGKARVIEHHPSAVRRCPRRPGQHGGHPRAGARTPSILSGTDHDLADLVAASSSPPRVAVPHRIDGHRYIDAGIVTTTSADRAPAADLLVVVAPTGRPRARPPRGHVGADGRLELMRWRMTGGQVLYIRPDRAVGALAGTRTTDVLDPGQRRAHLPRRLRARSRAAPNGSASGTGIWRSASPDSDARSAERRRDHVPASSATTRPIPRRSVPRGPACTCT